MPEFPLHTIPYAPPKEVLDLSHQSFDDSKVYNNALLCQKIFERLEHFMNEPTIHLYTQ